MSSTLFIIAAPSGAGKTSLVRSVAKADPHLTVSISHTTRPPRVGETSENYSFKSVQAFKEGIEHNQYIEYAKVFEHYYGTPREWVEDQLSIGKDVVLEIDWQGAALVREKMPCVSIFILPPSKATLRKRLEGRRQDSTHVIEHRLQKASEEMSHYLDFDYLVINDDFDKAVLDIHSIIRAQRCLTSVQQHTQAQLLSALVGKA